VIGVVGILEDVHKTAKMHFAQAGRTIVLLRANRPGDAVDAEAEFWVVGIRERNSGSGVGLSAELISRKKHAATRAGGDDRGGAGRVRARLRRRRLSRCAGGVGVAGRVGLSVRLPKQKLALEFVLFRKMQSPSR